MLQSLKHIHLAQIIITCFQDGASFGEGSEEQVEMYFRNEPWHELNLQGEWTLQTAALIKSTPRPLPAVNKEQLKNSLQKWAPLINLMQQIDAQPLKLSKQFC